MTEQSAWRLVYTKPRQEIEASKQLERQGYTIYLPMLRKRIRQCGEMVSSQVPLFPRYLFIHLTEGLDDWGPIRSTRGVSGLVRFGMKLAHVPDGFIADIREREMEDGFCCEATPRFKQGDKVRITDGPFSDYEAVFQAPHGENRVLILLDLIGKATRVEMAVESIVAGN
ncbi:MAG: transcription/translation regulatory transformer protein RfaH [Gammaproteobacteria bacterium]|nr:transcription/translation regulatory transformer protein RfaH [Gammaproteobacteria bacterium]